MLDEVHRTPAPFPVLRGLIDRAQRKRRRDGLCLLPTRASLDLLQQAGGGLVGHRACRELTPLNPLELPATERARLGLRGGFPESCLTRNNAASLRWRQDVICTCVGRGFHVACDNLQLQRKFVVHPGLQSFSLGHGTQAVTLPALCWQPALKAQP